jgi:hypothetical protein
MLTFLRRIRKGLLAEGAAPKYLLYAIGEITLVVIGILIALQINNWNQAQINKSRETEYLSALLTDFTQTEIEFQRNREQHSIVQTSMEQLLDWCETGYLADSQHLRFDTLLGAVFRRPSFKPPLGTLQTILGSGNVDLITTRELVAQLTQWTALVEDYQSDEQEAIDHFHQSIYPFLKQMVNMQDMDKGIPRKLPWLHGKTEAHKLVSNQEFHNIIYVHWVLQMNTEENAKDVDGAIARIKGLTQEKLK